MELNPRNCNWNPENGILINWNPEIVIRTQNSKFEPRKWKWNPEFEVGSQNSKLDPIKWNWNAVNWNWNPEN